MRNERITKDLERVKKYRFNNMMISLMTLKMSLLRGTDNERLKKEK